jgi:DNA-binding transcriptional LysR family regulator
MELRHLRYFIVIAEELNLRRAAERLNISHPPLSRQLSDLEQEIGVTLVARGKRGLALSDAGRVFLAEARSIVAHAAEAIESARGAGRGEAGLLRLAYPFGYFEPSLARVMRSFRELFPLVRIEIEQSHAQLQIDRLQRNLVDIAYCGLRFPGVQDRIRFECVRRAPVRAVLPSGHPLCDHDEVPVDAMADQPFVALGGAFPDYAAWLFRHSAEAGFKPRVVHVADTNSTLFGLVAAGFGVALLPALHDPPAFEVEFRPICPEFPSFEFDVAWRRDDRSPIVKNFLSLLREIVTRDAAGMAG